MIMDDMVKAATAAAKKAGALLKIGFQKKISYRTKGSKAEIVSNYDVKAEKLIVNTLKQKFPRSSFILEEGGHQVIKGGSPLWIVDPLDGTTNFVNNIPFFAVSIAGFVEDELTVGVIYHPITNELFTAVKGKGAYLNGKKLKIKKRENLEMFATRFPTNPEEDQMTYTLLHFLFSHRVRVRDFGSTALEMAYVAANRIDVFWISRPKSWDIAAGVLLTSAKI
jgi:myo-inositol-1(or 4)-monophosphatase